jgi:hypothetical protein
MIKKRIDLNQPAKIISPDLIAQRDLENEPETPDFRN